MIEFDDYILKIKDNKMANDEAGLFMSTCQIQFDWHDMCSAFDPPAKIQRFSNIMLDMVCAVSYTRISGPICCTCL